PLIRTELDCATGLLRRLRFTLSSRSLLLFVGLFLVLHVLFGGRLFCLILAFFLVGVLGDITFANARAIADAHHHHDVVGFLLREDTARNPPPIEIAFGLVTHQPRVKLVFPDDRDFRRIRERIFESVAKPIRHGVAQDDNRRRRDRFGFRIWLAWGRRARVVYRRLLLGILISFVPTEETAEETTAATA